MMRVLLINPPIREWSKPNVLPLGLAYIAAALSKAGHEVQVMDINAFRWSRGIVDQKLQQAEFDLVGIGAIVTVYGYVKWLAQRLRYYHPDKKIVVGGSVGSSIPETIMGKTSSDIICMGEGEETIVDLAATLEAGRSLTEVKGIWFRGDDSEICRNHSRDPVQDLDTVPFPLWDLFPMDIYAKNAVGAPNRNKWIDGASEEGGILSMNISGTRGCPYKCIYCYHDFMGCKYRHRSPGNIVAEMRILHDKYDIEYFHFIDDEFCLKRDFVLGFCKGVLEEFNGRVQWGCTGRVNLMTEDMVSVMADAGCSLIGFGIESGSQKMLDTMKKGVTVDQAKEAVLMTKKYLGWADCSFMVGTPGENRETIQETIDFCKELDLAPEVIFFATPYPGTELYEMAVERGMIADEEEYVLNLGEQGEKICVNFSELSDDELLKAQNRMISELNAWNRIKHPESR